MSTEDLREAQRVISEIDTSQLDSWSAVLGALLRAGFSRSDLGGEFAASEATLSRWLDGPPKERAVPREMTRRLLKNVAVEMVSERLARGSA
jgi:hypothetical protein